MFHPRLSSPSHLLLRLALLGCLFLVAAAVASCSDDDAPPADKNAGAAAPQSAPPAVKAVRVEPVDIPQNLEFVAQTQAKETIDVRARVAGFLEQRHFDEGGMVDQGQLLFTIDPSQLQQTLNEAQATLERNRASYEKAKSDTGRFRKLLDQGAVSEEEYETYATQAKELEATLASNRAAVEQAKINLGYTKVHAPITGRIGRAQVKVGNLVGQGENTLLAQITSVDPIYVNFSVSEDEYLAHVKQRSDAPLPQLQLLLSDGELYPHNGTIDMADPTVDRKTGTIGVRAVFPNPKGVLLPGLFGRVRAPLPRVGDAIMIPQVAVMDMQGLKQALTVSGNGTVQAKTIRLGGKTGSLVAVQDGLAEGDVVLVEGLQKFRPGMQVAPTLVPLVPAAASDTTGDAADNATTNAATNATPGA